MANYNGYLKYKKEDGEIATLLPKTTTANVVDLQPKLDALQNGIDTNAGDITTINGNITAINNKNTDQDKEIAGIKNVNTNQEREIAGIKEKNIEQDNAISGLQAKHIPQLFIAETEPDDWVATDWWFDASKTS